MFCCLPLNAHMVLHRCTVCHQKIQHTPLWQMWWLWLNNTLKKIYRAYVPWESTLCEACCRLLAIHHVCGSPKSYQIDQCVCVKLCVERSKTTMTAIAWLQFFLYSREKKTITTWADPEGGTVLHGIFLVLLATRKVLGNVGQYWMRCSQHSVSKC